MKAPTLPLDRAARAIVDGIVQAERLYHRLVLVAGSAGAGKSDALTAVSAHTAVPVVNVGLELSRRMLEFAAHERARQVRPLLEQLVAVAEGRDIVLLDHIELLFDADLHQDPLRLLQGLSRDRTVVAAWTGALDNGTLRYAVPGHPEHGRYPAADVLVVPVGTYDEMP